MTEPTTPALKEVDMPRLRREKDESIEDFMTRLIYAGQAYLPIGNDKYVNIDADGNQVIMPEEMKRALEDMRIQKQITAEDLKALRELADKAEMEKRAISSMEKLKKHLHETMDGLVDDKPVKGERGKIPDEAVDAMDENKDDKVSNGELRYFLMNQKKKEAEEKAKEAGGKKQEAKPQEQEGDPEPQKDLPRGKRRSIIPPWERDSVLIG